MHACMCEYFLSFLYILLSQVVHELELMFSEDDVVNKISSNWQKMVPKLIEMGNKHIVDMDDAEAHLAALQMLDNKLRKSAGQRVIQPSAFSIYEVNSNINIISMTDNFNYNQPGTNLHSVLKEKVFPEPRLILITREGGMKDAQGRIVEENEITFEINNFNVLNGITSLIATYYAFDVSYPKPATASSLLLFIQEALMDKVNTDKSLKKTAAYRALTNCLM